MEQSKLKEALETAIDIGYRHFDTAHIYRNEKIIGEVLYDHFKKGKLKRPEVFITHKENFLFMQNFF